MIRERDHAWYGLVPAAYMNRSENILSGITYECVSSGRGVCAQHIERADAANT